MAEDATQEVFIQVWRKIRTYRGDSKFSTWLHAVASNTTLQHMRKQKSWASRYFRLEDEDVMAYHDEPIYRDGILVGRTTSGAWSYTEDRCLAMGYVGYEGGVGRDYVESGIFEVEIAGDRIPATASLRSFYDPAGRRVRQ